jgi:hypothetical protein
MLSASEIAAIQSTISGAFDVTITIQRKAAGQDNYSHANGSYNTVTNNAKVNVYKPSATQLQSFAGLIGSQWALMVRYLPSTDIQEGDQVVYNGTTWLVQNIQNSESYTWALDALITAVK